MLKEGIRSFGLTRTDIDAQNKAKYLVSYQMRKLSMRKTTQASKSQKTKTMKQSKRESKMPWNIMSKGLTRTPPSQN